MPPRHPLFGHNQGPPLETPLPWGEGRFGNYFEWKQASEAAFKRFPYDSMVRIARKAEGLGLTYREYVLEILERGRYLQLTDTDRIAEIVARRPVRY